MIVLKAVLLLAGTAVATCYVLKNGKFSLHDNKISSVENKKPCLHEHEIPANKPTKIPRPQELPPTPEYSVPYYVIDIEPQYIPDLHEDPAPELKPDEILEAPVLEIDTQHPPETTEIPEALSSLNVPEIPPVILPANSEVFIQPILEPEPFQIIIPDAPTLPPDSDAISECDESPTIVEGPYPNPVNIPEAPVLPPFTMPEKPTVVELEAISEPKPVENYNSECDDHVKIEEYNPITVPEAPVLPPFTMPEVPTVIEIESVPDTRPNEILISETPSLLPFPQTIPECDDQEKVVEHEPIAIPEAPVLPPFAMPEIPTAAEIEPKPVEIIIPESPVLSPFPQTVSDCDNKVTVFEQNPISIPEAPVLPPFTNLDFPQIIHPHVVEWQPTLDPKPIDINVPDAPNLPSQPDCDDGPTYGGPIMVEHNPKLNLINISEHIPINITLAPVLPSLNEFPEFSQISVEIFDCEEDRPPSKPLNIPEAPTLPPVPPLDILKPVEIVRPVNFDCPPSNDLENFESEINHIEIPAPPQLPYISLPIVPDVIEYKPLPSISNTPEPLPFIEPHNSTCIIEEATATEIEQSLKEIPLPPVLTPTEVPVGEVKFGPSFISVKPTAISQSPEIRQIIIPAMQPIVVANSEEEPCHDDKKFSYQKIVQPTFWAQNIIIDRVFPNMVINDRDAKSIREGIKYPVITY